MIQSIARRVFDRIGYHLVRHGDKPGVPCGLDDDERRIITDVDPFTMTSHENRLALIHAVRHVVRNNISGDFVECGVWRGGSSMVAALTLLAEGDSTRDLHLFDTFQGMTAPTVDDVAIDGRSAAGLIATANGSGLWKSTLGDVRANMASTGYPTARIHYYPGPVEQTIPVADDESPIAILRLDTDWYESTRHELEHLWPRLVDGGVLIIDDYGHWKGARKAVDEFLTAQPKRYFLHRIDYTARLIVK